MLPGLASRIRTKSRMDVMQLVYLSVTQMPKSHQTKDCHEWLKEEIIEKVPHKELDNTNYGFCSYVPFHMITKETPNVTKYRIVHNASARRKNTPSLNDLLYKGPVKLPDVLGTLIRFGQHRIAVTADVKAAFN
uniref:Reverse transcriptase domain-containing protein n=1 Tax=Heterorhabditis bacteriophora TaxID=37862 RepID=A0A1I7X1Q8_HETBA